MLKISQISFQMQISHIVLMKIKASIKTLEKHNTSINSGTVLLFINLNINNPLIEMDIMVHL